MSDGDQRYSVGPDDDPDKYRLRRQFGGGGEAELWEADVALAGERERVAVKILRPELAGDPRWRARWAEQVELLRLVQHPSIVGVHAQFEGARMHLPGRAGEQRERALYLVMNWVDGEDLRSWVPQHRSPADLGEALRLLGQTGSVLDWLHSGRATPSGRPVVHGDISPSNVVVNRDGQAVLVDFGLFRITRHITEVPIGTRGYCAPEVVSSGEYSPASDRYAFGGLAHYLLTGTHPPADRAQLLAGLATIETLSDRELDADELAAIFATEPELRPSCGDWLGLLRRQTSTTHTAAWNTLPQVLPTPPPTEPVGPAGSRPGSRRVAWLAAVATATAVALGVALGATLLSSGQTSGIADAGGPPLTPSQPPATPSSATAATTPPTVSPPESAIPTASQGATEEVPPASSTPPWPGEPTGTVFIVGTVELGNCDPGLCRPFFDLDVNRETSLSGRSETDLSANEDGVGAQGQALLAPWVGSQPPTLRDCRSLPTIEWTVPFIAADQFDEPSTYCVRTTGDRYGYLQTQRRERYSYYFHYVLWMNPQDQ